MHTTKHPEGYLTSRLKRLLKKKIYPYNNPLTNTTEKLEGGQAAALATIWAALQGDMRAMEILLDRIDGKVEQKLVGEGFENKHFVQIFLPEQKVTDDTNRLETPTQATLIP
jgi:hypothetical protein